MKILCLIDSLGSGGAQRQLATLAAGFKKRGHEVRFLTYLKDDHFLPLLKSAGISRNVIPKCSYGQRLFAIRRVLRKSWQDVVLAFLEGPCLYAELARIPRQNWGLVAGERLAAPKITGVAGRWLRQAHRFADAVITNSHTNRIMLESSLPFLKPKLATIYNIVDPGLLRTPLATPIAEGQIRTNALKIVVAASYQEKKNMLGVAKALLCLRQCKSHSKVVVDWFGSMPSDRTAFDNAERFICENGLGNLIRLFPPTEDIAREFSQSDAVGLFSFYEGLPNAVCEGMACGKPILLSNVCDAGKLVVDGKNGFLCDPFSPESIAHAINRLASTSPTERLQMSRKSRVMAERLFNEEMIVASYDQILTAVVRHEAIQKLTFAE